MRTKAALDVAHLPGYRWYDNGQSALSGPLLELDHRLDRLFCDWAAAWQARDYHFPTFIPACELDKLDYFRSFPHLVTFPVTLAADEDNLQRFTTGERLDAQGALQLTTVAPIQDVLTPAACYHFYIHFQGENLEGPRYVTTRATCFRRERQYVPLARQWSFSMREIVCIGTAPEVEAFLASARDWLDRFVHRIGLPTRWQDATDPFFNPSQNPKYLMQKLDPVKTELVFQNHLAVGSINFHRNYFGEAFHIRRDGQDAFSGCVAFGIDRWIYAFLTHFGLEAADWPELKREEE